MLHSPSPPYNRQGNKSSFNLFFTVDSPQLRLPFIYVSLKDLIKILKFLVCVFFFFKLAPTKYTVLGAEDKIRNKT